MVHELKLSNNRFTTLTKGRIVRPDQTRVLSQSNLLTLTSQTNLLTASPGVEFNILSPRSRRNNMTTLMLPPSTPPSVFLCGSIENSGNRTSSSADCLTEGSQVSVRTHHR
jgi:hypothetical protein